MIFSVAIFFALARQQVNRCVRRVTYFSELSFGCSQTKNAL